MGEFGKIGQIFYVNIKCSSYWCDFPKYLGDLPKFFHIFYTCLDTDKFELIFFVVFFAFQVFLEIWGKDYLNLDWTISPPDQGCYIPPKRWAIILKCIGNQIMKHTNSIIKFNFMIIMLIILVTLFCQWFFIFCSFDNFYLATFN